MIVIAHRKMIPGSFMSVSPALNGLRNDGRTMLHAVV
jgi:hypothetical protein